MFKVVFASLLLATDFASAKNPTLLSEVETHYRGAHTVTMDVSKTLKLKLLEKEKKSEGTIQIKKGGKLRWETASPEHSLVLADGHNIWIVDYPVEEDEKPNIIKANNPKKSQPHAVVAFLMGQGRISDDFKVIEEKKSDADHVQIDLRPKHDADQVQWLNLSIDTTKKNIDHASFADAVGNVTELDFKNVQFDQELDNKLFKFVPPQGSEVTILR